MFLGRREFVIGSAFSLLAGAETTLLTAARGDSAQELTEKWKVLHFTARPRRGVLRLPKSSPLEVLEDFEITGPKLNDPFLLGKSKVDGDWGIVNGLVQQVSGRHAALKLGRGENFEFEGVLRAEGVGGWYILVGWDKGHGYAIYNVNLKVSGSPWHVCEFRGGTGIDDTHEELNRYECRGAEGFRMSVVDGTLNLQINTTQVIEDLELPNYHEGDIILGTYDTKYGPKPVKIQSLRIRKR